MGHQVWLQVLAGILGSISTGALVALSRYVRNLLHQLATVATLESSVTVLGDAVKVLQETVSSLDEAVAGLWAASIAAEAARNRR